ncbi:MAG: hypothetical protein IKK24_01130 [Clostridia bacterium]|nr:hypothetical protein [Clostridia bacterium]
MSGDFMKKAKSGLILFSLGACGYGLIELLWRGHTHWSMLTAGGISFCGLSTIGEKFKSIGLWGKAVIGGGFITAVEFLFGIAFNIILKKNVWDYSKMPLNIAGQICALYSFFWVLLSFFAIPLAAKVKNKIR